jgi:hypothetical protein
MSVSYRHGQQKSRAEARPTEDTALELGFSPTRQLDTSDAASPVTAAVYACCNSGRAGQVLLRWERGLLGDNAAIKMPCDLRIGYNCAKPVTS